MIYFYGRMQYTPTLTTSHQFPPTGMVHMTFTISTRDWGQGTGGHKRPKSLVPSPNL